MRCIQITEDEPKKQIKDFYSKTADGEKNLFELDINKDSSKSQLKSAGCDFPLKEKNFRGNEKVLEVGVGGGINCSFVSENLSEEGMVVGLDFSQKMLKEANRGLNNIKDNNVQLIIGDGEKIPFKDNYFDLSYTNCVINLVNKQKVLSELYRVTKKQGSFFFSEIISNKKVPSALRKNLKAWVTCLAGATTKKKLEKILEENQFRDIKIKDKQKILEINEHDIGFYKAIISARK